MAKTSSLTADNISFSPITAPVACKLLTIRQTQSNLTQVEYDIAAPSSADTAYRKSQGEETTFGLGLDAINWVQAGTVVGYIRSTSGTVTYSIICEP